MFNIYIIKLKQLISSYADRTTNQILYFIRYWEEMGIQQYSTVVVSTTDHEAEYSIFFVMNSFIQVTHM